jgi:hypothetical protein
VLEGAPFPPNPCVNELSIVTNVGGYYVLSVFKGQGVSGLRRGKDTVVFGELWGYVPRTTPSLSLSTWVLELAS